MELGGACGDLLSVANGSPGFVVSLAKAEGGEWKKMEIDNLNKLLEGMFPHKSQLHLARVTNLNDSTGILGPAPQLQRCNSLS